jgi:hypothetical protein
MPHGTVLGRNTDLSAYVRVRFPENPTLDASLLLCRHLIYSSTRHRKKFARNRAAHHHFTTGGGLVPEEGRV